MTMHELTLTIATTFSGLMAGFFFAFTVAVNSALGKLDNRKYLEAMQSINKVVLNPLFFLCFFGPLIFLPLAAMQQYGENQFAFLALLVASFIYIVGVFGITGLRNVPLNNQLEAFRIPGASEESLEQMRSTFEKPWVFWNNIRTAAAVIAFAISVISCFY